MATAEEGCTHVTPQNTACFTTDERVQEFGQIARYRIPSAVDRHSDSQENQAFLNPKVHHGVNKILL
jgi:hypothetical protein